MPSFPTSNFLEFNLENSLKGTYAVQEPFSAQDITEPSAVAPDTGGHTGKRLCREN